MRALICAAALTLAAGPAMSDVLQGEELKFKVEKGCQEGCLVLTPEEVSRLELAIQAFVAERLNQAYELGKQEANELCRNKI